MGRGVDGFQSGTVKVDRSEDDSVTADRYNMMLRGIESGFE